MTRTFVNLSILLVALTFFSETHAGIKDNKINFQKIFSTWTKAFNEKKFPEVCELFSKSITADYQGTPRKDYSIICNGFKKIFAEKNKYYHNAFKIHHLYHSNDLAAVRITWYLDVYEKGKHISSTREEGLDIFQKQANGDWKIIYFLAYPLLEGPGKELLKS